jgi:hypothetical protein
MKNPGIPTLIKAINFYLLRGSRVTKQEIKYLEDMVVFLDKLLAKFKQ